MFNQPQYSLVWIRATHKNTCTFTLQAHLEFSTTSETVCTTSKPAQCELPEWGSSRFRRHAAFIYETYGHFFLLLSFSHFAKLPQWWSLPLACLDQVRPGSLQRWELNTRRRNHRIRAETSRSCSYFDSFQFWSLNLHGCSFGACWSRCKWGSARRRFCFNVVASFVFLLCFLFVCWFCPCSPVRVKFARKANKWP